MCDRKFAYSIVGSLVIVMASIVAAGCGDVCAPGASRQPDGNCAFPYVRLIVTRPGDGLGLVTSDGNPGWTIDCGSVCSQNYNANNRQVVTLTAAADIGSVFLGWGGDCAGTGSCSVTMDADRSVAATFSLARQTLTVIRAGSGVGSVVSAPAGIDCGLSCSTMFDAGTVVTLIPTPAAGSVFSGFSGDCSGAACMVTMDRARTVTASFALSAEVLGAWGYGSTGRDWGSAVATDAAGDVFVTGSFEGMVNFGGGLRTSAGFWDIFIAKYSGLDGRHLWSRIFGNTGLDSGAAVAVDAAGDVLFTGIFQDTVDFGGGPLASLAGTDIIVAKYSGADGTYLWSRGFGSSTLSDGAAAMGVDVTSGDVVLTGSFRGPTDFGGGPVTAGSYEVFVAKYAGGDGAYLWARHFGSATGSGIGEDVAVAADGDIVVTGQLTGTVDFGGGGLASAGFRDVFVLDLGGSDGRHLWSRRFGGAGYDNGTSVALDASGDAVVAGLFTGSVSFGDAILAGGGTFLAKYSGTDGAHLWSERFDGAAGAVPLAPRVSVDSLGDVVMAGPFSGTTDFGGGALMSAGLNDAFVGKFSGADGMHRWSRRFGGAGDDWASGVATDASGRIFVTDYFTAGADFGAGPLPNLGGQDVFLLFLGP